MRGGSNDRCNSGAAPATVSEVRAATQPLVHKDWEGAVRFGLVQRDRHSQARIPACCMGSRCRGGRRVEACGHFGAACALRVPTVVRRRQHWSARGVRLEIRLNLFRLNRLANAARAAAFLSIVSSPLQAQTIVVTGVREPLALERLAADVVVIDEATIRNSRADSVADLLRREAGLQLSRTGGPGHGTGLFIRGANASQTVVLVDGVRIGSATLGQPFFDGLSLAQIERIEVLRGPGSSVYGADAIGGVVQVFTRRGEAGSRFDAQAALGGYDSLDASVGASGRSGRWDLAASASHEQSDGVSTLRPGDTFGNYNPDADGYRLSSAQAQIGFRPAEGHRVALSLMRSQSEAQYDSSQYLPPDFTQDNTPDFRDRLDTAVTALDWRGTLREGLTGSARLSASVDELQSGASVTDRYRTERNALSAQLAWASGPLGELVGAIDYSLDRADSSQYLEDVERRTTAIVLALTGSSNGWSWQGDVRRDDTSDFGGETTARLGGGVMLAPGLRLRALAGSTFRAPSFNDLYYPGYGVPPCSPNAAAASRPAWTGAPRRPSRHDALPQPRRRPDRLRERPQLLPTRTGLRLRLRAQHPAAPRCRAPPYRRGSVSTRWC